MVPDNDVVDMPLEQQLLAKIRAGRRRGLIVAFGLPPIRPVIVLLGIRKLKGARLERRWHRTRDICREQFLELALAAVMRQQRSRGEHRRHNRGAKQVASKESRQQISGECSERVIKQRGSCDQYLPREDEQQQAERDHPWDERDQCQSNQGKEGNANEGWHQEQRIEAIGRRYAVWHLASLAQRHPSSRSRRAIR